MSIAGGHMSKEFLCSVVSARTQICTRCSDISESEDLLSLLSEVKEDTSEEPRKLVLRRKRNLLSL